MMDSLSELLKSAKMQHCRAGIMQLCEPWGLAVTADVSVAYGVAQGGPCWLHLEERSEAIKLETGDVILVRGPHCLRSSPEVATADLGELLLKRGRLTDPAYDVEDEPDRPQYLMWGGEGREAKMFGIALGHTGENRIPLLRTLPQQIVLRAGTGQFPWMSGAVEFLSSTQSGSPGYAAAARLLAELVLVSIVRAHVSNDPHLGRGWLRGLKDPNISKALQAIHEKPGHHWSVDQLAKVAGCSRTIFATRFAELVEVTPFEYLTQWRMHLAEERISTSRPNLSKLALELGYLSDAAFRIAFKRRYGMAPSHYRRTAVDGASALGTTP